MVLQYTVVDAFTSSAFAGNPACVIIPGSTKLTDEQMQLIAREYNLSETAFLEKRESKEVGVARYGLRWFTPALEVKLCGHATLASSHVLFTQVEPEAKTLKFDTLSGELTAKKLEDGKIELEFPAGEFETVTGQAAGKVKEAVERITADQKLEVRNIVAGQGYSFQKYVLVEVGENVPLKGLTVNPGPLADLSTWGVVILTQPSSSGGDCDSRVFGPLVGVPEDPVTGSAHCLLGPYWSQKLKKAAKEPLSAKQVSPRGGELTVVWDQGKGTCKLQGAAVTVLKGELLHLP